MPVCNPYHFGIFLAPCDEGSSLDKMNPFSSLLASVSGGKAKAKAPSKDPEDLKNVRSLNDAANSISHAVSLKSESFSIQALDICSKILEDIEEIEASLLGDQVAQAVSYTTKTTLTVAVENLGSLGVCGYVDQLFGSKLGSAAHCNSCLRLLCLLITYSNENRKKVAQSSDVTYRLVKALQMHTLVQPVIINALKCIRHMSIEDEMAAKFVNFGACEATTQSITLNSSVPLIVELGCRIIYNLTHDIEDSSVKFALNGVCEVIVVTILQERFKSDTPFNIAQWALRAIGGLARRNEKNKITFANLGACELVMQLIETFSMEKNASVIPENEVLFCESAFWAIGNLAYPDADNQNRFGTLLACEKIIAILNKYIQNSVFVRECFRAIRNLGHENDANLKRFADCGACDVIIRAIAIHFEDSDIVQWGWFAVSTLATSDQNVSLLEAGDVSTHIVNCLIKYCNIGDSTQWICMALSKVASNTRVCDAIGTLKGGKVHTALIQALTNHMNNSDVVEEVCAAMGSLCTNQSNAKALAQQGCSLPMLKALSKYERDDLVVEQGLRAISHFVSHDNAQIISRLVSCDGCNVVCKVITRLYENTKLSEYGCNILNELAKTDIDKSRDKLIAAGVLSSCLTILTSHSGNMYILSRILQVFISLCSVESSSSKIKALSTLPLALTQLLIIYCDKQFEDPADIKSHQLILELLLVTIKDICKIDGMRSKLGSDLLLDCLPKVLEKYKSHQSIVIALCFTIATICGGEEFCHTATLLNATGTLSNLSSVDYELSAQLAEVLGARGVCGALINALQDNIIDEVVVYPILCAVRSVSALLTNRPRLDLAGACEQIIQCAHTHKHNLAIVETLTNIIGNLALRDITDSAGTQDKLGQCGACAVIGEWLLLYGLTNQALCEAACRATAHLAYGNEVNADSLATSNTVDTVLKIISNHLSSNRTVIQGFLVVAILGESRTYICDLFVRGDIAGAIASVLKKNFNSEGIIESSCRAVITLNTQSTKFSAENICEPVVKALVHHMKNESVAHWLCKVIFTLAKNNTNKPLLAKYGACEAITSTLQRHIANETVISVMLMRNTSNTHVAQWGCDALFSLTTSNPNDQILHNLPPSPSRSGKTSSDEAGSSKIIMEYQRRFVAAGACDAIAKVLIKYNEIEPVAQACCRAVLVLAYGNELVQARLGSLGVCAAIIESLRMFPASAQIACWGCSAVAALSDGNNEANISKFSTSGACEALPASMQAHQNSAAVAEAGCTAIANMTSRLNSNSASVASASAVTVVRLGHAGACEAVVTALKKHVNNAGVVKSACLALANLGLAKGNAGWFGATGACEALLAGIRSHMANFEVCAACCEAFGNLCNDNNNRFKLGSGGACELAVECINIHPSCVDVGIWAAYAIGRLCEVGITASSEVQSSLNINANTSSSQLQDQVDAEEESSNNDVTDTQSSDVTNRSRLIAAGACKAVVDTLKCHFESMIASFHLCRAISILAHGDHCSWERDNLGNEGGCEAVVMALQRHTDSEGVVRNAALALRSLSYNHGTNQHQICFVGGGLSLIQALQLHKATAVSSGIIEAIAWAVHNLSIDSSENKSIFGKAGACDALVGALELHGAKNVDVAHWICFALYQLCSENVSNTSNLSFSVIASDQLNNVMIKYPEHDNLVMIVCRIMLILCSDRVGQHKVGKAGACKQIAILLQRSEREAVPDCFIYIICQLIARIADRNTDNKKKLSAAGICSTLSSLAARHITGASQSPHYLSLPLSSDISAFEQLTINTAIDKNVKKKSILSSSADTLVSTAGSMVGSHLMLPKNIADNYSTPTSRYCIALEACKAITVLAEGNSANKKKFISFGVGDIMTSFVDGGHGYYDDGAGNTSTTLRNLITETLQVITSPDTSDSVVEEED